MKQFPLIYLMSENKTHWSCDENICHETKKYARLNLNGFNKEVFFFSQMHFVVGIGMFCKLFVVQNEKK